MRLGVCTGFASLPLATPLFRSIYRLASWLCAAFTLRTGAHASCAQQRVRAVHAPRARKLLGLLPAGCLHLLLTSSTLHAQRFARVCYR